MLDKLKTYFKSTPKVLDQAAFTTVVLKAIVAAHGNVHAVVSTPLAIALTPPDGDRFTERLERVYEIYRQEPQQLEALVKLRVASVGDFLTVNAAGLDRAMLVPVLLAAQGLDAESALTQPFDSDLTMALAFDLPTGIRTAAPRDLERLTLERGDAFAIALDNIDQRGTEFVIEDLARGLWLVTSATLPASSALLAKSFWHDGPFAQHRLLAAFAPDDQHVLVVDLDDEDAIAAAPALAEEIFTSSTTPLSSTAIVIKDETETQPAGAALDANAPTLLPALDAPAAELASLDGLVISGNDQKAGGDGQKAGYDESPRIDDPTTLVDRIVPLVMSQSAALSGQWFHRSIGTGKAMALAYDLPGGTEPLRSSDIAKLGGTIDELFDLAIENVGLRRDELEVKEIEEGAHLVVSETMAPAAALFCKPLWAEGYFGPNRDLGAFHLPAHGLLVIDPRDDAAQAVAEDILRHFADALSERNGVATAMFTLVKRSGDVLELGGTTASKAERMPASFDAPPIPAFGQRRRTSPTPRRTH